MEQILFGMITVNTDFAEFNGLATLTFLVSSLVASFVATTVVVIV